MVGLGKHVYFSASFVPFLVLIQYALVLVKTSLVSFLENSFNPNFWFDGYSELKSSWKERDGFDLIDLPLETVYYEVKRQREKMK